MAGMILFLGEEILEKGVMPFRSHRSRHLYRGEEGLVEPTCWSFVSTNASAVMG